MDLLNCPKCNKEVDSIAEYCPSCGCKIKKRKVNPKMVIIPIILVVITQCNRRCTQIRDCISERIVYRQSFILPI